MPKAKRSRAKTATKKRLRIRRRKPRRVVSVRTSNKVMRGRASKEKRYGPRKDLSGSIQSYVEALPEPTREIAEELVALVRKTVPDATSELKWGMPVFSHYGMFCYLRAQSKLVRFGFYDYADAMRDPNRRLEGAGKGKHVKVKTPKDIDRDLFAGWIRTAAKLNAAD